MRRRLWGLIETDRFLNSNRRSSVSGNLLDPFERLPISEQKRVVWRLKDPTTSLLLAYKAENA